MPAESALTLEKLRQSVISPGSRRIASELRLRRTVSLGVMSSESNRAKRSYENAMENWDRHGVTQKRKNLPATG